MAMWSAAPVSAQAADTSPPPTPTGVVATASGGEGGPTGLSFAGEDGTLDAFSSSANAAVSAAAAHDGDAGVRVSTDSARGYVRWRSGAVGPGNSHALVSMWVRVIDRAPGESVDLLTIANCGSTRNFDLFLSASRNRFQWDLFRDASDQSDFVVNEGQWYFIEARVSYSGSLHWAEVRIDGVAQGRIESAGTDRVVTSVTMGSFGTKTHTQDYDTVEARFDDAPIDWGAMAGQAPEVTVSWDPVVDEGSGIREYQIWRNGGWYGWVTGASTSWVDPAPVDGAYYQVRAIDNALNRSGWSARAYTGGADDVAPPTPDNVTAVVQGDGSVLLAWDPVVDTGGSGLREYAIFRDGRWYGWVPAPITQFVDASPVANASYRVSAYDNALNQSARSAPVSVP